MWIRARPGRPRISQRRPRARRTPHGLTHRSHTPLALPIPPSPPPAPQLHIESADRPPTPQCRLSLTPQSVESRMAYMGSLRTRRAPPRTVSGLLRGGHWPLAPHPAHPRAPSPRRGQRGVYSAPHPTSTTTEVRARVQRGSVHCGQRRGGQSDLALGPRTGHLTLLKSA